MKDMPTPPQPASQAAPQPRRRWLVRLARVLLLILVIGAGLFVAIVYRTRSNPPFVTALKLIQADPQLGEHLGTPIRDTRWLPSGAYPEQFNLRVEGPKGAADVSIRARQLEGAWVIAAADAVVLNGATRLSLDTGAGGGPGDAPSWSPPGGGEGQAKGDDGLASPEVKLEMPEGPPGVNIQLPDSLPDMDIQMPSIPAPPKP